MSLERHPAVDALPADHLDSPPSEVPRGDRKAGSAPPELPAAARVWSRRAAAAADLTVETSP
ncbi:hypothetical protein GCM10029978_055020 [Actinoallomurus acanthiterrae]